MGVLRGVISPKPSLFDVLASGILLITFFNGSFLRGTYFIFYSVGLICMTMILKRKREYISLPLTLFLLWSLFMVFNHNEIKLIPIDVIMNHYFNVTLMSEGFIYIFIGIFLFKTLIEYSTNLKFIYLLLPFSLIPLSKFYVYGARITPVLAIGLGFLIYLILRKKYLLSWIITLPISIFVILNWKWVLSKFACRPYVFVELIKQIGEHPFIGSGFNHTLYPNNMIWVRKIGNIVYGWIYRHNDFLSIGAYLGIFTLICVIWFMVESVRKIGIRMYLLPILIICIMASFQMTMFEPDKAAICLVLIAISIKETLKEAV